MAQTAAERSEVIPGTEIIFDNRRITNDGEGEAQVVSGTGALVLIPHPTQNADDPLNWSARWKGVILLNQFVFVFVSIMTPLAIAPMTLIFEQEFRKTLPEVNMLFGAAAITLGYANFLIVPAANLWGRRPVILVCSLVCIGANVWQGLVTSYGSFIGARIVSGLGAAANESIMPMVVADLLFVHQRGRSMALYFWAYFMGLFIGPIISGAIASQISWRWFASFVFILVAHPETKYDRRPHLNLSPGVTQMNVTDAANKSDHADPKGYQSSAESRRDSDPAPDNTSEGRTTATATVAAVPAEPEPPATSHITNGAPFRAQFSVLFPGGSGRQLRTTAMSAALRDVISPVQILCYPIVLWAALAMGFAANSLLALNLTQAQVFGAAPYHFTPDQIGFVNFAFVAGAALALVTAGPLSDWIALRRAARPGGGGVLEAEMRLPALIPYVVISFFGMAITAVGYQMAWPWEAIVVAGYMLVGIQVVGIPAIAISYAVDSYKSLPGEIMIAATIVKNTFGFGMIFFFNDWAAKSGYIAPVLMLMALTVGFSVLGLAVFIPYGKRFRRMTMHSKLHAL
ncbi:hypothetical protein SLS62_009924 [Diatrype stigma]|uniref:Major facilitator superfamily (MFS) profile domain-containing protein n=1 Tax=Diatrype stigma TaxID=117547 RepID=A0AAN9UBK9_9PEZI